MSRKSILSWCLYDWANSAFSTVIFTFVFSLYFARGIYGDPVTGSSAWGYAIGIAGFFVAILSPLLGGVADFYGRRKPWVLLFTMLCVVATALLWFAEPQPDYIYYTLGLVILATIGFELAIVFYNAMLPDVAPKHMLGRVSGWAWGLGYVGGLLCLVVALLGLVGLGDAAPLFGVSKDNAANIRASGPLVALWMLIFSLPLFLFCHEKATARHSIGESMRMGLSQIRHMLGYLKINKTLLWFLIASALYRDGLVTLFAVGGLYAGGTFNMDFQEIMIFAIGLNVTAGIGAALFAFMDDRSGSRKTIIVALCGLIATGLPLVFIDDKTLFIGLSLLLGIFIGPVQAASRTYIARLAAPEMVAQSYGFYALTGKSIAFLGPLCFAWATDVMDSQRAGMFSIILFMVIGLILLLAFVKEKSEEHHHV